MRLLLAPMAGAFGLGGITRCLAVGEHAALRGHEVAVCAPEGYPLLDRWFHGPRFPAPRPTPGASRQARTYAEHFLARGFGDSTYAAAAVAAERAAIREFGADVVFTENQITLGISTELERVPLAATAATVDLDAFAPSDPAGARLAEMFERIAVELGATPRPTIEQLMHHTAALNLAPTLPELEPDLRCLPNLHYVGALLYAPIELGPLPPVAAGRKRILVYLSRGLVTIEDLLHVLPDAFLDDAFEILLAATMPRVAERDVPFRYRNVRCERLPPLTSALRTSALLLTRGGQNTAMAALLAGCPVIGVPGGAAEPAFNLRQLEQHGVARVLEGIPDATALRRAGDELLSPAARARASGLGRRLRRLSGAARVVHLLEELVEPAPFKAPGTSAPDEEGEIHGKAL